VRLRPSTVHDHPAVLRLLAARDQRDFGEPDFTAPMLIDQWRSRAFDPAREAVVAEDASGILGYAAAFEPGVLAFVHPAREGEGIGTELLRWTEESTRTGGAIRQRVAASNRTGRALLEGAGYRCARSVHYLAWNGRPPLLPRPLPDGITLHALSADRDARELHQLDALGFSGNPDYHEEPFEAFVDEHLKTPDLNEASSCIARHAKDGVGFILCRHSGDQGYIDLLAVRDDFRRRGVGRALLCHALMTLADAGVRETTLDVASDNAQALRLYRGVGMTERHEVLAYEKTR
jgi:mycothiol synthase